MDDRVMAETGEGKRPDERRRSEPTPWRVEGDRRGSKDDGGRVAGLRLPGGRRFWWFLLALLALNWLVVFLFPGGEQRIEVPYTVFREQVDRGNVVEVRSRGEDIQGEFEEEVTYPPGEDAETSTSFETVRPSFAEDDLFETLVREDVVVSAEPLEQARSFWLTLILSFGPTLLLVGLFIMLIRRTAAAGAGGIGGLGRSRAKRYEMSERRTTFADVAGIDEAEEQLVEIVDFLKNPDRYRRLGAAIPKGARRRRRDRRARRARADAQPDPDRDGRVYRRRGRHRPRRDEPPRRARPGAPAPGPVRPPRLGQSAGPGGAEADPRRAHALRPARRRRRPRGDRLLDARHGGRGAAHRALRGGSPADGLPRGGTRHPRHAPARRRPGAEGVDRPPRAGAGRHLPEPGRRPLRLRRRLPARPNRRGARRPRGGGARLRRRDHRGRVGSGAGDAHRSADGRPLGHVGRRRQGLGATPPGRGADALPGRRARVRPDARARRRRGAPDRGRVLPAGARAAEREPRAARHARRCARRARDARRGRHLPHRRHRAAARAPTGRAGAGGGRRGQQGPAVTPLASYWS